MQLLTRVRKPSLQEPSATALDYPDLLPIGATQPVARYLERVAAVKKILGGGGKSSAVPRKSAHPACTVRTSMHHERAPQHTVRYTPFLGGCCALCLCSFFKPLLACVFSTLAAPGWKAARSTASVFISSSVTAQISVIRRSIISNDKLSRTTTLKISVLSSLGGSG